MSSHWGYCAENGPHTWHQGFPQAAGDHQSPIDIKPVDLKSLSCSKPLQWKYTPENLEDVVNTGHGWQVTVKPGGSSLTGGPLNGTYELAQFHCHWGTTNAEGSEHTINGQKFAGELHFVHWNSSKYPSIGEALKHPDGLSVLGVFLKPGAKNDELDKIVSLLDKVEYKNQKTPIVTPLDPAKIIPKDGSCGYFTYQGSLTTPPCSECVIWIVFKEPIEVSEEQLKVFRNLKFITKEESAHCDECRGLTHTNYRPTLPVGKREVLESR